MPVTELHFSRRPSADSVASIIALAASVMHLGVPCVRATGHISRPQMCLGICVHVYLHAFTVGYCAVYPTTSATENVPAPVSGRVGKDCCVPQTVVCGRAIEIHLTEFIRHVTEILGGGDKDS